MFRLRLHYDDDPPDLPRTIIVKLPLTDPALRMVSDRLGQDRREVRFYQEVAASSPLQTSHSYHAFEAANLNQRRSFAARLLFRERID